MEDLVEISNRHEYWRKKLTSMKSKLDKTEERRDAVRQDTETLQGDVSQLQRQLDRDTAALREVSQFRSQQELLYQREKSLLQRNQAELSVEAKQSQKLISELEKSTKEFLRWNSLLECQEPKDTYIRHLIEDASKFYYRRFEVLSEPEANRRLREVTESLEQLEKRVECLSQEIKATSRKKEKLLQKLGKQLKKSGRKSKLEKEVDQLEEELYNTLRSMSSRRDDLAREVNLLEVQLQEIKVGNNVQQNAQPDDSN